MTACETAKSGAARQGISPDVAATAEVLRALYLPSECGHLVELLCGEEAACAPADRRQATGDRRQATGDSRQPMSDAAFLDTVQALFANDTKPLAPVRAALDLRDTLQIRVRFLDALQDELRRARAGGGTPRLPDREALARLLEHERARYGPDAEPAVSAAIREQLRAA
jgi:hypothetical protein